MKLDVVNGKQDVAVGTLSWAAAGIPVLNNA